MGAFLGSHLFLPALLHPCRPRRKGGGGRREAGSPRALVEPYGAATSLRFSISQHSIDLFLLKSFVDFFNCGYVANYKNRLICEFIVTKIDHIIKHIIPFFEEHPILGSKYLNYLDFNSAAKIIKNKEHLNPDGLGLEKILQLALLIIFCKIIQKKIKWAAIITKVKL